jgi:hypothetical protein
VRTWTRRFAVDVPEDVERLRVELPFPCDGSTFRRDGAEVPLQAGTRWSLADLPVVGGTRVDLRLASPAIEVVRGRRPQATGYFRRGVAESRDRLAPLVRKLHADRILRRIELRYDAFMRRRVNRQLALRRGSRSAN